jgi:hypothetical protein
MSQLNDTTPEHVAQWMLEELYRVKYLYQEAAVFAIQERFGEQFYYINEAGNLAIDRKVLSAFKKITGDTVVWERGERLWRMREAYDTQGRQQS